MRYTDKTWRQIFAVLLLMVFFGLLLSIPFVIQPVNAASLSSRFYKTNANPLPHNALPVLQYSTAVTIYLPIIDKSPTPTPPLFFDDFSNPNSGWFIGPNGNCQFSYVNGRYKVELKAGNLECWGPGPSRSQFKYGLFETLAFIESNTTAAYGFYLNGRGGNEYYLFIVRPNDSGCSSDRGKYEFYRTHSGNRSKKLEGCSTAVKRGSGSGASNLLQVNHTNNGVLSIYVNGILLGTFTDSDQLTGTGTGTYSSSGGLQNVVRYEYFAIYNP